jgi:hypothetical protein
MHRVMVEFLQRGGSPQAFINGNIFKLNLMQATVLIKKCEECTSASLLETDWQLHRQLCLMVGEGDVG